MKNKLPITAIVLTYNEERNLKDCLDSINDFVDEIIIVDSISNIKPYIPEDSINFKTLEFSLQSRYNKLNIKFSKNKRRSAQ